MSGIVSPERVSFRPTRRPPNRCPVAPVTVRAEVSSVPGGQSAQVEHLIRPAIVIVGQAAIDSATTVHRDQIVTDG